ncbi:hypothetical protein [Saccharibacillus sp. JS10]|uniref:hypothetical protein n=1 Tax=Saccharibacillus sp. JS10 TaxID=2950552 RepID=UPI00210BB74C|nr:hypothetical protein [Saccharibacillus sp. JS10]MCQ4088378.1 hypothetical protein [Saccharibacillus sp. JS10]
MALRIAFIVLYPILFCCALFAPVIASWQLAIAVAILFIFLWKSFKDVLISTAILFVLIFPLTLWTMQFYNPIAAMNIKPWMYLLDLVYVFLFMTPQLFSVEVYQSFRKRRVI